MNPTRYNDFGEDGGAATVALTPKFDAFSKHVVAKTGVQLPPLEIKHLVATGMVLKGFHLTDFYVSGFATDYYFPILYDFYNYDADSEEFAQLFIKFTQNSALIGDLLFFIGMMDWWVASAASDNSARTGLDDLPPLSNS
ncbi:hypothetical protein V2J09_011316 [Rumex salicifolius]